VALQARGQQPAQHRRDLARIVVGEIRDRRDRLLVGQLFELELLAPPSRRHARRERVIDHEREQSQRRAVGVGQAPRAPSSSATIRECRTVRS
jgi:hypothetical protein